MLASVLRWSESIVREFELRGAAYANTEQLRPQDCSPILVHLLLDDLGCLMIPRNSSSGKGNSLITCGLEPACDQNRRQDQSIFPKHHSNCIFR
jgi:hypothetical protein